MLDLCAYKNIFGEPNTGIHSYRLFDIAVVDAGATLLAALIVSLAFDINFLLVALGLFGLGIFMHRMFCVRTTVDKLLFS